jgi:hypothetical protein
MTNLNNAIRELSDAASTILLEGRGRSSSGRALFDATMQLPQLTDLASSSRTET